VYAAASSGQRYPNSEQLPRQRTTFNPFTALEPREREAKFHRLVLGDREKEVALLGEQLAEELRDALHLLKPAKKKKRRKEKKKQTQQKKKWDAEVMNTALDAGKPAAEIVGANPVWLQTVGHVLAGQLQNRLLPVLLDWVVGMSHTDGKAAGKLLVELINQLQGVWANAEVDDKSCCSHRLGTLNDSESPFGRLCREGTTDLVRELLVSAKVQEEAADVVKFRRARQLMAPNPANGDTPLTVASQEGHAGVVEVLLALASDRVVAPPAALGGGGRVDASDGSALSLQQERLNFNRFSRVFHDVSSTLRTLVKERWEVTYPEGKLPLVQPIMHQDLRPQNVLLSGDGKPVICDFGVSSHLLPEGVLANSALPLYMAAQNGHTAVVKSLLAQEMTNVNEAAPLLVAAQNGHVAIVEALLAHTGIDVNQARTDDGATPLLLAAQNGHGTVAGALLAHDDIDVNQGRTADGATPLLIASVAGHVAVVKALLAHTDIKPNQSTSFNGATPLLVASQHGHAAVVKALLTHEAIDMTLAQRYGVTPLMMASSHDQKQCVELLLAAGANRNEITTPVSLMLGKDPRENCFRLSVIVLDVLVQPLRALFKASWDAAYPAYPWDSSSTCGDRMLNGAGKVEEQYTLAGTFELKTRLGKMVSLYFTTDVRFTALPCGTDVIDFSDKKTRKSCWLQVAGKRTEVLSAKAKGLGTWVVQVNREITQADLDAGVSLCYTHYEIKPEGKQPSSEQAMDVLRTGDEEQWDTSLLAALLLTSSHNLLKSPPHETFCVHPTTGSAADFKYAAAEYAGLADAWLMVEEVRVLRNVAFACGHRSSMSMEDVLYDDLVERATKLVEAIEAILSVTDRRWSKEIDGPYHAID
jgi:ankyrin repeat protein